jgi:hypothetical protein
MGRWQAAGADAAEQRMLMQPGAKIAWDIHYSNGGEDITDFVELGIYFYPKGQEPKYRQHLVRMGQGLAWVPSTSRRTRPADRIPFSIAAGRADRKAFLPHMHLRGKAMTLEAILPSGQTGVLSHVGDFNFNWHNSYVYARYAAPLLPRGPIIMVRSWHDNTAAHKSNPDPNVWVGYGDRTVDEMAHAWVNVTYLSDEGISRRGRCAPAVLARSTTVGRPLRGRSLRCAPR